MFVNLCRFSRFINASILFAKLNFGPIINFDLKRQCGVLLLQALKFTNFYPKWWCFSWCTQALLRGPLAGPDTKSTYSSAPFDSRVVFHLCPIPPYSTLHYCPDWNGATFAPARNTGSPRRRWIFFPPPRSHRRAFRSAEVEHAQLGNVGKIGKRFKMSLLKFVRVAVIRIWGCREDFRCRSD